MIRRGSAWRHSAPFKENATTKTFKWRLAMAPVLVAPTLTEVSARLGSSAEIALPRFQGPGSVVVVDAAPGVPPSSLLTICTCIFSVYASLA